MTMPLVPRPGLSMRCSGCDSQMVITRDAIGRERLRCPKCQGIAPQRRHPDDAMIPQGLVRASVPVRVIREIVRVTEPAPVSALNAVALPPLRPGYLRCQLCAEGVDPSCRFCSRCATSGREIIEERDARLANRAPGQRFAERICAREKCGKRFQPTAPASKYCAEHRR